jgi:octaprenyl-diphosphate synthase
MYEYIRGKVAEVTPTYAVIDAAGVGYLLHISLETFSAVEKADEAKRNEILSLIKRCATDESCVEQVQQWVVASGGIEAANQTLKSYLQRAMSILGGYEESPYRQALIDLCTFIAERNR